MVGDIKQSIYRFRNANPYIFKNKYDTYSSNNGGIKIDLNKNFRSREEVINNINDIDNHTVAVLKTDLNTVSNDLSEVKKISYLQKENVNELEEALKNKETNYVIVPYNMYMDFILKNDLHILYHLSDISKKYVSISFDAAWGDEDTIKILDILDKYNIKTTFFMTGGWVDSYPDKVLEIYNRGHDLGNHSQNHKEMSKLSVNEQKDEIMSVANKIKEITGYTSFLFRPPYGDYNSTLIDTVYGCNFYPIEWDVDSLDWKDYGTDNIIKTVTTHKALKNGSIILMHNGAKYTAEALESVITGLQSQGYEIVPISQLINTENFHMDGTGLQIPD